MFHRMDVEGWGEARMGDAEHKSKERKDRIFHRRK